MTSQEEQALAKRYGAECIKDEKRGRGWCSFKKDGWHIWSTGLCWVVARLAGNRYTDHKKFDELEDALKDVKPFQLSYDDGRKNGWLDASIGIRLQTALNCFDGQYASGYLDGQNAYANGKES